MTRKETTSERLEGYADIFENSDFKKGATIRKYWSDELRAIAKQSGEARAEYAENLLDYLDDFNDSVYYLRDEVRDLLNDVIEEARAQ